MRIILVADNASTRFGGEAFLAFNYFKLLRRRGVDVKLVVHARNETELHEKFPGDLDRMYFVRDTLLHRGLYRLGALLPGRLAFATTGQLAHLAVQLSQRRIVRALVAEDAADVVHIPAPVSPKSPSLMWGLGVPVIIGPLNGGMEYPDAFRHKRGSLSRLAVGIAHSLAELVNVVLPGKRLARLILAANQRTREALPAGLRGQVIELVENAVDFSIWNRRGSSRTHSGPVQFVFVGRLVDWKGLDILLEAFNAVFQTDSVALNIIGDGPMREAWQSLALKMGLASSIRFSGFMSQEECARNLEESDVFVLPSLFECGGAVVLEAMAMELPVIATAWGGPTDYLDENCGVLIAPHSRETLVDGFADAMRRLARSPELRNRMGLAGGRRARELFDWEKKIDQILQIYQLID
jgi:glycosyltransferase involved in cell wall biosynthesis